MTTFDRRQFLASSALAAATAAGAADRPNDRVRLAVMGVHGRGKGLLSGFSSFPDVEIAAIIDPDENVIGPALKAIKGDARREPRIEKDVRKALEDRDLTALVIAAPDHWHALATVWACQAGKHVYVEKPISHNLVEGRRLVDAARKHGGRRQGR